MKREYPEWIVVLAGRIVAAVTSGEYGRPEVAELIRKTVTAEKEAALSRLADIVKDGLTKP